MNYDKIAHCRVASRNFVTACLSKDVTGGYGGDAERRLAKINNESFHRRLPPSPHSLLQRIQLTHAVVPWVTTLELNEQLTCSLIRMLLKTLHYLLPVVSEDVGASASRLVGIASICPCADDDPACASILAPAIDTSKQCWVLPSSKSTWELGAQLLKELYGTDVGKVLQTPAYDRPGHAQRLDSSIATLGINRQRLLLRL